MNMAYAIQGGKAVLNALTGTSRASSTASSTGSTTSAGASNSTSFIDLLLSQITNQNPMEPMDNATMVTQLAQFEMVEKMDNLDDNISSMMVYQNMMNSINVIGKNVTITNPDSGETITGKVESVQMQNGFPQVVVSGKAYDFGYITKVE